MIVVNDNGDLQDQKRLLHWKKEEVKTLVIVPLEPLRRKVTVLVGLFDCHFGLYCHLVCCIFKIYPC
jgi:hypothetical protein